MRKRLGFTSAADAKATRVGAAVSIIILVTFLAGCGRDGADHAAAPTPAASNGPPAVELTSNQLGAIQIAAVGTYAFPVEKESVGSIDFDGDRAAQVFPPCQGKILKTFVQLGDTVQAGQELYTIESPDLIQAESTLIGAAGTLDLTSKELARAKDLYTTNGVSQREMEQAVSDQQTAEGALKAARDALRIFGKMDAEMDQIIAHRKMDPALVVRSPMAGQVTAMNAPPGYLVQPGTPPAPYAVADVSVKWMLANVAESDSALYRAGQPVEARVMAYPGRVFAGNISKVYETVDPNLHTLMIRSEIADANNELHPGMLANFVVRVQDPVDAIAIPATGVVREGDGTFTAWVTTDRQHFTQRIVKIGLQRDNMDQIVDGLRQGELVVSDGAVFLSNMLEAPPSD